VRSHRQGVWQAAILRIAPEHRSWRITPAYAEHWPVCIYEALSLHEKKGATKVP